MVHSVFITQAQTGLLDLFTAGNLLTNDAHSRMMIPAGFQLDGRKEIRRFELLDFAKCPERTGGTKTAALPAAGSVRGIRR